MSLQKIEKFSAALVIGLAIAGFALSNSPLASLLSAIQNFEFESPILQLSITEWVSKLGLAVFFLLVGIELRTELSSGNLKPVRNAIAPLLAAIFGVAVPAIAFLAIVGPNSDAAQGWVIPTATDVSFALVIFTLFGRHMRLRARSFLLAFAVIDDLIALVLIAVLFTKSLNLISIFIALIGLVAFRYITRKSHMYAKLTAAFVALLVWFEFEQSGIHPTLAGLALGLMLPKQLAPKIESLLKPWVSFAVLPVFALFATAIAIPSIAEVPLALFIAICIRPITKWIGIALGGFIGNRFAVRDHRLKTTEILRVASLGGIGFTVSLLVIQLSLPDQAQKDAAALATLFSAFASMAVGAVLLITGHRTKSAQSS